MPHHRTIPQNSKCKVVLTMTEQFGATPLPQASIESPLKVWYDPSAVPGHPQQPHAQQVAAFETEPNDDCINGSLLDVNQHFVVYAVKNGLIRVLHRSSTLRALLRGHYEKVTDMAFFQNSDVLGSVGGNVIIWRIFHRSPEIMAEKLLEIPSTLENIYRLIWHPFNPNQFWLLQENVATLVETTRITTVPHEEENHAICQWHSPNIIMDGAVQLGASATKMTDLCWSGKDTKHVLTTHQDGKIALWDVKMMGSSCIQSLQEEEAVTRCMFLPHDNLVGSTEESLTSAFLTASRGNSLISLWSAWGSSSQQAATTLPIRLQTFGMEHPSTYNLDLCFGQASSQGDPPAFFLLMSDRKDGKVFCVSLKSIWSKDPPKRILADYFDYVVPFSTKFPIYSWSMACVPAEHVSEGEVLGGLNFDMKFHAYQSRMVQHYTLPHYMCLPPSNPYGEDIPGIRVERVVEEEMVVSPTYDEEYELDEEYESENEDYEAPAAESLPIPQGLGEASNSPFANWLGVIAAKTTGMAGGPPEESIPPPPPPTPATSMAVPSTIPPDLMESVPLSPMESGPTLLHPAQLLSGSRSDIEQATEAVPHPEKPDYKSDGKKKKHEKAKANGGKKTPPKPRSRSPKPDTDVKIAILKRENAPAPAPETTAAATSLVLLPSDLEDVLKKTLSAHFKRQESFIADQVQRAVKQEIQTSVVPTLSKMMTQTMEQAVVKPVKAALDKNAMERTKVETDVIVNAVSSTVEEPLTSAFMESMKTVLVPAYESATRQMFLQVASSLESGLATTTQQRTDLMEGLTAKLDEMARTMESLSSEVAHMRSVVAASSQRVPSSPVDGATSSKAAAPPPPPVDAKQATRNGIIALLQKQRYEAAFTQALTASTADMAVFCCKNSSVSNVLGGTTPALSQPILLCLMQQLGAVLVSSKDDDLQMILEWLQEIGLTLDPTNPLIRPHVPGVLQQLVASIDTKMAQGDPTLRRPLQMLLQVIRGMQR